ncbi:hypothetical protein Tco_0100280, partial [Tanacetum coccineum]
IFMANPFPPNHAGDFLEVDPVLPDIVPVIPEPAPLAHEYVLLDEDKDPKEDPEEEPQEEEELEDEMDIDLDDEMDDPKVIYPYEVKDGEFPPPPGSDSEPEEETVPTGRSTIRLLPPVCRFQETFMSGKDLRLQAIIRFLFF